MKASLAFVLLSVVGVAEAFDHAWLEGAFTTNLSGVAYSSFGSFFGVPYWAFGVVWFPLILAVGLWTTRLGQEQLKGELLALLTIGNIFTGYLWFLDLVVVRAFTAAYVGLYVTNYALTGLVVAENWRSSTMKDFSAGTVIGIVVGVFFGPFGAAAFGLGGGVLGALSGYTSTR